MFFILQKKSKLCYELVGHKWVYHSTLVSERDFSVGITMPNGIYLFGGWSNPYSSDFLPKNSKTWIAGPDLPIDEFENIKDTICTTKGVYEEFCQISGLKVSNQELVLIGLGMYHTEVIKFNIVSNTWNKLTSLYFGRHGFSCALVGNKIMVSGGHSNWCPHLQQYSFEMSGKLFMKSEIIDINEINSGRTRFVEILPIWYNTAGDNTSGTRKRTRYNHGPCRYEPGAGLGFRPFRASHGIAFMTIGNEKRLLAFGGTFYEEHSMKGQQHFPSMCQMWDDEKEEWVYSDLTYHSSLREMRYLSIPYIQH